MEQNKPICQSCGGNLKYSPGTTSLTCEYCGTKNLINQSNDANKEAVREIDYKSFIANKISDEEIQEVLNVKCNSCGAEITFKENLTADQCPFCGISIIATHTESRRILKPKAILPFKIDQKRAQSEFKKWLGNLSFAPNKLKHLAKEEDGLKGIYLPFWTYDTKTGSAYSGQRGTYYNTTESYTTMENGKTVTKTREVRKTMWSGEIKGKVSNDFDDTLITASKSLPEEYLHELEPWGLNNLVAYDALYVSGFRTESYQIDVEKGFDKAKEIMSEEIHYSICKDIGGDTQKVNNVNTNYSDITFKHILLPVWISTYRYQGKVYRFIVNARTGEVQGERPYSWIKMALLTIVIFIIGMLVAYFEDVLFN